MKDKTQFPKAAVAAMWVFDFVGDYESTIFRVLWYCFLSCWCCWWCSFLSSFLWVIKVYNYKSRIVLFLIYMPTAASTWGLLGDLAAGMCVDSLCDGPVGILLLILIIIVISMLIIIIHYYSFYLTNIFNCSVPFSAPSDFLWPL